MIGIHRAAVSGMIFTDCSFRWADALRFKLQREINPKDDEISPLIIPRVENVSDSVMQLKKSVRCNLNLGTI
jgi:hypothetical protein